MRRPSDAGEPAATQKAVVAGSATATVAVAVAVAVAATVAATVAAPSSRRARWDGRAVHAIVESFFLRDDAIAMSP